MAIETTLKMLNTLNYLLTLVVTTKSRGVYKPCFRNLKNIIFENKFLKHGTNFIIKMWLQYIISSSFFHITVLIFYFFLESNYRNRASFQNGASK